MKYKWQYWLILFLLIRCTENADLPQGELCRAGTDQVWILVAESMPKFVRCEDFSFECNQQKIDDFVRKHQYYPKQARRHQVEGDVVVKGVVEKEGCFSIEEVVESLGYGCDEEAIRLVNLMPRWNPGMKDGKEARVREYVRIKFRL